MASAIIDSSGLIVKFQLESGAHGRMIPVDTSGVSIFDTLDKHEAIIFLGLINYSINTGEETNHIHAFKWGGNEYLRHATIRKKNGSKHEALVTIKPYP